MNRRELLMGVAATPIAWALKQYALTHTEISFSGWLPSDLGWVHMCWNGDQWFVNGELQ